MTNIYIHIGTHKTGTTTIQHALRDTVRVYPKEGWVYQGTTPTANEFMQAEKYDKTKVQQFHSELQSTIQRRKSANRLVLSSEALSGFPRNGYQNSNVVYSMLRDATTQYNVKIIIYLRSQDSFVESIYTQMIHQGETLDFGSFIKQYDSPDALNYCRMLDDLRSCFGDENLIVKSYHEASKRGLLHDFGDIIESKSLQCSEQMEKNPSYSHHALEIAKICNASLDQRRKSQLRGALQLTMAKKRFEQFSFFSDKERAMFLERFKMSNTEVANRYFNGSLETLFPIPNSLTSISQNERLTYNEVARVIVQILNGSGKKHESAIISGARVALSGYPRLGRLLRKVLRRM